MTTAATIGLLPLDEHGLVSRLERALARQELTQAMVIGLADTLSVDEVAALVLEHASGALDAVLAGLALLTDDRQSLRFVRVDRLPTATIAEWPDVPLGAPSALTRAVRDRQPLFYRSQAELLADYPHLTGTLEPAGHQAFASIPLVASGRALGALSMAWATPRDFGDDDRAFLRMLGAQCAQAVERAQLLAEQTDVATTLQQAMLPDRLPERAGVELSACYLPASTGMTVGGDWFDAFDLADGRLVVAVGDVSGHGLTAAAVMGQVRNGLRAYLIEGHDPATALSKLDIVVDMAGHGLFATIVVGIYDPGTGDFTWSNAGHPPLLVYDGEHAHFLESHIGAPIGVRGPGGYRNERTTIVPGVLLVAYTDGLVERRYEDPHVGLDRLAATLASADALAWSSSWAETLVADVLADGRREDDVCVLALRRPA